MLRPRFFSRTLKIEREVLYFLSSLFFHLCESFVVRAIDSIYHRLSSFLALSSSLVSVFYIKMHYKSNYFRQVKSKVRSPFSSSLFLSPTQVSLYHQNTLLSLSSARSKKRGCSYITRASKCRNQKRNTSMVANTTAIPRKKKGKIVDRYCYFV